MVKLVLYIQPIPREQWEQIWASTLLKGWRINLMCMFWWWWGKPDYLEETLHTKRPQWDGKLGPSCCWPLCYFEKQIFSNTQVTFLLCFHPVSSSFLFFVVFFYVSQRRNGSSVMWHVRCVRTYSDLPPSSVSVSINHHFFFYQSFMIWWKHDYCLRKRWTGFLLLEAEVAERDRHNSLSLVSYNQC